MQSSLDGLNIVQVELAKDACVSLYLPDDWTAQVTTDVPSPSNIVVVKCKGPWLSEILVVCVAFEPKDGQILLDAHHTSKMHLVGSNVVVSWVKVTPYVIRVMPKLAGVE